MTDPIDEIIEKTTRMKVAADGPGHRLMFYLDEVRAVCEAGIEYGNRLTTEKLVEARKLMEANNAAQDSAIKARRELARKVISAAEKRTELDPELRLLAILVAMREIAEEGE